MTTKNKALIIPVMAFFAGCLGGPTLEALVVRPLSAQQVAAGVQRWEYQCVVGEGRSPQTYAQSVNGLSNQLGAEGWEMSGTLGNIACFKRPLP